MNASLDYNPFDWYWIVGDDESRVWSSAARGYLSDDDATYLAWLDGGRLPSRIISESDLWAYINLPVLDDAIATLRAQLL